MKKFKTALIGCGRIAYLLEKDPLRKKPCTHYGGAKKAGILFNAACDTDTIRLQDFAEAAKIPPSSRYTDYLTMLKTERPHLVIITAWTQYHHDMIIAAANCGAKVIVCEKPIAASLKDARHAIMECRKHGVKLFINHERRYDPAYMKVKSMIEHGAIGRLLSIRGSMMTGAFRGDNRIANGGGPLLHDGTHLVDLLLYFAGNAVSIQGKFTRYNRHKGFEDYAAAKIDFDSGATAFIEAGGGCRYFCFELDIVGTEGRLIIGNGYRRYYAPVKSSLYSGFKDLAEKKFPAIPKGNCFVHLYQDVAATLSGTSKRILSSGDDAYRALEIINAVYLSSHTQKEVPIPLNPSRVNLGEIFSLNEKPQ